MKLKKPEIKSFDCIEHDPIENWQPDDPSMVEFWCNFFIGIEDEEGADNFLVHVVTEKMLSQIDKKEYLLVLPYYENFNQVIESVNATLNGCCGLSWPRISESLSKLYLWEYQDYKE